MERQGFNLGGFLKGILIGSLVGGVIALFAAPHSGAETRQMLMEQGEQVRDRAGQALDTTREKVETAIADTRQQADEMLQRIGEKVSPITHRDG